MGNCEKCGSWNNPIVLTIPIDNHNDCQCVVLCLNCRIIIFDRDISLVGGSSSCMGYHPENADLQR